MLLQPDFTHIDQLIDELYPQMLQDLSELISYPSVEAEAAGKNAPFGQPVAAALQCALAIAERFGFSTRNVDGYMGTATLEGTSSEAIGVLTHVDVVPVNAADWQSPPFTAELRNDCLFGRGALDNKGPLIASIYALAALKTELNAPLSKSVQLMFGCNEESGMQCLEYYLKHNEPPICGFSPDAEFPLIIGEKGIIFFKLCADWPETADTCRLLSLQSGTAANIVPDTACARLSYNGSLPAAEHISCKQEGETLLITATGKAAHASTPELGDNALVRLLSYLTALPLSPQGAASYIRTLAQLFNDSSYGTSCDMADADELSTLTLVPSMLNISQGCATLSCDLRFPVSKRVEIYRTKLQKLAAENGLQLTILDENEPLYGGNDNATALALLEVYREYTGDNSPPLIIGGGTYAKALDNFFAFGMEFSDTPQVMHQANEFIRKDDLLKACKIYARAIYRLAK